MKAASRRRRYIILGSCIAVVVVLALLIGILVKLRVVEREVPVMQDPKQTVLFKTDMFTGQIGIVDGPLHKADIHTTCSKFVTDAFIFQMEHLVRRTPLGKLLQAVTVTDLRNGTLWQFQLIMREAMDIIGSTERDVTETLRNAIGSDGVAGIFIVDLLSVQLSPVAFSTTPVTVEPTVPGGECVSIDIMPPCAGVGTVRYQQAGYPTIFGHGLYDALLKGYFFLNLTDTKCYEFINLYWCAVFAPKCVGGVGIPPCRHFCQKARDGCGRLLPADKQWFFQCDQFPETEDPDVCLPDPSNMKPRCEHVESSFCHKSVGTRSAIFPNLLGHMTQEWASKHTLDIRELSVAFSCHPHVDLFGCTLLNPKCSASAGLTKVPPCRSLCEAVREQCFFFYELLNAQWLINLNCSNFPESHDISICIGQAEAIAGHVVTCQPEEHTCDDKRCLPPSWVCDSRTDCADASDEQGCAHCSDNEFQCDNGRCLPMAQRCDTIEQCSYGEDEINCTRLSGPGNAGYLLQFASTTRTWRPVCLPKLNKSYGNAICKLLGYSGIERIGTAQEGGTPGTNTNHTRQGVSAVQLQMNRKCKPNKPVYLQCQPLACGLRSQGVMENAAHSLGREEKPGVWPWLVSLHGGPGRRFFCGGALLSDRWVLTAAHCIAGKKDGKGWTVKIGNTRLDTETPEQQVRGVQKVFKHPKYNPSTLDVDVGLLELDVPVALGGLARPVCLPSAGLTMTPGMKCTTAGWGKLVESAEEYSRAVHSREVSVIDRDQCRRLLNQSRPNYIMEVTNNTVCAMGALLSDACYGDSGCIMACQDESDRWYAAGVVSWGLGCGRSTLPGVYAKVSPVLDWISDTMAGS